MHLLLQNLFCFNRLYITVFRICLVATYQCDSFAFVCFGFWIVKLKDVCRSCLNQEAIYSKLIGDERITSGLILGFHYKIGDKSGVDFVNVDVRISI